MIFAPYQLLYMNFEVSSLKTIRVAVIGVGRMGKIHIENFSKISNVKVVACADKNIEHAREIAEKFGIPAVYSDYREMLKKEKLDAVSNATTDDAHYPVAMQVLKRKIPILSEKPLATNLKHAQKMRDAAQASGVINMVNFSYRNRSALQRGAAYIRSGAIGKVLHVEASQVQDWHYRLEGTGWKDDDGSLAYWALWRCSHNHGGTGVFGDVGCHILDFVSMFCDEDIAEISSFMQTYPKSKHIKGYDMEANNSFVCAVKFAGGGEGVVHVTHAAPGNRNALRIRIFCEEGSIEFDSSESDSEYQLFKRGPDAKWETIKCDPTPSVYERFIEAVRTGIPSEDGNDFANGCKIQAYLHYGFKSAQMKKAYEIKL